MLKSVIKNREDRFHYAGLATKSMTETLKKIGQELKGKSEIMSNENNFGNIFRIEEVKIG